MATLIASKPETSDAGSSDIYIAPDMLINGRLVPGAATLEVINPATGTVFAHCGRADVAQLNEAVQGAVMAFPAWSTTTIDERAAMLDRLGDAMEAHKEEFAALLTKEQGKTLNQSRGEMAGALAFIRFCVKERFPLKVIRETDAALIVEQRIPLGVVATITPWNFPISLLIGKLAPALLTGNTVISKPAPTTPLTTLLLGAISANIFPPGVLNIIVDNNDLGTALTEHPQIAKVSFTGSTATGKRVMASAAGTLKRLTLELGGNDAAIVLDDVDVQALAPKLFMAGMYNAGQVCMAAKRIYAPRAIYEELCEALAAQARKAVVGAGDDPATQIGPIQNRKQYERVLELVEAASKEGTIIAGGPLRRDGYFVAPTIVRDLKQSARIVREEQFGPVMPVMAYDSEEEVIAWANDSDFGLAGTIWSSNVERAMRIAERIHTGTVWINKFMDIPVDVAFGGAKQSGVGQERGRAGIEEFTQRKILNAAK